MGSSTPVRIRTSSLPSSKGQGQLSQGQRRVELAQHGPLISSSIVPMAPTGNINTDHSCSRPGTQTWFSAAAWAQRTLWLWVAAQATQISTAPEAWPSDTNMAPAGDCGGCFFTTFFLQVSWRSTASPRGLQEVFVHNTP